LAPEAPVACHNDLLRANFLRDGRRLWLLDWEYAGMNDRSFDLGNLCVNNQLDDDAVSFVTHAYRGRTEDSDVARVRLMSVVSDAREAMWGVVQQGISTLDVDYVSYAAEHFDRLLTAVGTDRFRADLTLVAG
jgi:thiamine kinase-like enzyme